VKNGAVAILNVLNSQITTNAATINPMPSFRLVRM
jgi:hypothetical protein